MRIGTAIPQDIRDSIFVAIQKRRYTAHLITESSGIISGVPRLQAFFEENKIAGDIRVAEGGRVTAGCLVAVISGTPKQIAVAEEFVVGFLAKPSGIATAAGRAVTAAGPDINIVCGAWKKMPPEIKQVIRESVVAGGASFRLTDQPFLYLDKNFVRMLGGIEACLTAVVHMTDRLKAIQIKGESGDIAAEALLAARLGADILMVDTGRQEDVMLVNQALVRAGCRAAVKIAFAKGVKIADICTLKGLGIDILDIGAGILDAPLLDMKLEVQG